MQQDDKLIDEINVSQEAYDALDEYVNFTEQSADLAEDQANEAEQRLKDMDDFEKSLN